jgi:hypothetical protein
MFQSLSDTVFVLLHCCVLSSLFFIVLCFSFCLVCFASDSLFTLCFPCVDSPHPLPPSQDCNKRAHPSQWQVQGGAISDLLPGVCKVVEAIVALRHTLKVRDNTQLSCEGSFFNTTPLQEALPVVANKLMEDPKSALNAALLQYEEQNRQVQICCCFLPFRLACLWSLQSVVISYSLSAHHLALESQTKSDMIEFAMLFMSLSL